MTEQSDRGSKNEPSASTDLISLLSQKVVGQSSATKAIVPYVILNFISGSYRRTFAAGAESISTAESEIRADSV